VLDRILPVALDNEARTLRPRLSLRFLPSHADQSTDRSSRRGSNPRAPSSRRARSFRLGSFFLAIGPGRCELGIGSQEARGIYPTLKGLS
jgi:hypothetical protein